MLEWEHIVLIAIGAIIIAVILTILIRRHLSSKQTTEIAAGPARFQAGIQKLHQQSLRLQSEYSGRQRANYYVFRRAVSTRPLFSWSDHPTLITDAVEHGWSRFGFIVFSPSPSTKSSLLGLCAAGDYGGGEADTVISWEIFPGSADFMQKIRLNSAVPAIRTALPLPGPKLGDSAFPQEAYFEITILHSEIGEDDRNLKEGEKAKLIEENLKSESLVFVRLGEEKVGGDETAAFCLGLTAGGSGGSWPLKSPGSYGGSIGFNSDGSIYLDGIKLVSESPDKGSEWAKTGTVIGCGYDPRQKKVFFTLNAELVQVINCKTEEFGAPLYPTMAAKRDTLVLVNFGQSAFSYSAANAQRTSNPCFIGPMNSSALGYEDSKELFSMGRIDSQWHMRSAMKSSQNQTREFDDDEGDLFEIVLDSKSPNTVL